MLTMVDHWAAKLAIRQSNVAAAKSKPKEARVVVRILSLLTLRILSSGYAFRFLPVLQDLWVPTSCTSSQTLLLSARSFVFREPNLMKSLGSVSRNL